MGVPVISLSSVLPNESFEVVLSTFGVMFAPDHERAASELMRVCKPGGRIGLASFLRSLNRGGAAGLVVPGEYPGNRDHQMKVGV